jgi:hypothetical protein
MESMDLRDARAGKVGERQEQWSGMGVGLRVVGVWEVLVEQAVDGRW